MFNRPPFLINMPLLDTANGSADFESARKLIYTTLTSAQLTDATMRLSVFAGDAEIYVAERTSNTDQLAKNAAIKKLAALLIPSLKELLIKSQSMAGFNWSMFEVDIDIKAQRLHEAADEDIARSETANPTDVGEEFAQTQNWTNFSSAKSGLSDKLLF